MTIREENINKNGDGEDEVILLKDKIVMCKLGNKMWWIIIVNKSKMVIKMMMVRKKIKVEKK